MKGLLITIKGGEDSAKKEIQSLIEAKCIIKDRCVEFEFEVIEDLFKLAYLSQVANRILLLDKIDEYLKEGMSFCVRCEKNVEEERIVGSEINKDNKFLVNLENPEVPIFKFEKFIGIDFTGDISKREFRVFTNKHTLKGTTASIILREINYTGKESLLDCFVQDGTLVLEAVHMAINKSVRYYDWEKMNFTRFKNFENYNFEKYFKNIKETSLKNNIYAISPDLREINAVKKNSKIAGINKEIDFAKKELEFLDQKFEENQVDLLVSYLPRLSDKKIKEFFHQAEYIAKKTVLLVDSDFKCNKSYFKISKEKILEIGNMKKKIVWLEKVGKVSKKSINK